MDATQLILDIITRSKRGDEIPEILELLPDNYLFVYVAGVGWRRVKKSNIVFTGEVPTKLSDLDTPGLLGQAGKILIVNETEDGYIHVPLAEVSGVTLAEFEAEVTRLEGLISASNSPVDGTYPDLASLIADQNSQLEDYIYEVLNTGEGEKGYYFYNGTTAGTIEDYTSLTSAEVAALTSQAIIDALTYTPANDSEVVKGIISNGEELPKVDGKVTLPDFATGGTTAPTEIISFNTNWQGGLTFFPSAEWKEDGVLKTDSREITLAAADPSLNRFDLFAVNLTTDQIEIIQGTPADPAVEPSYDPLNYLAANFVSIEAGATAPANVVGVNIWTEGAEWSTTGAGADFDFANTESVASGTYAIKAINPLQNSQTLPFTAPIPKAWEEGMELAYKIKNITGGVYQWLVQGVRSNGRAASIFIDAPFKYSASSTVYQSLSVVIPSGLMEITKISLVSRVAGLQYFLDDVKLVTGGGTVVTGDFADVRLSNVVSDLTDAEALLIRNKLKIAQVNGVTEQYVIDGDNAVRAEFAAADNDLALQIDAIEEANLIQDAQINNRVVKITGKGLSTEDYTTAEKTKLANIVELHKGSYLTIAALRADFPEGAGQNWHQNRGGWTGDVDAGTDAKVVRYLWDASDFVWRLQQGETTAETAESIATKYHSNSGIEAFTTTLLNKVNSITAIFTTELKTAYDAAASWVSSNGASVLSRLTALESNKLSQSDLDNYITVATSRNLAVTDIGKILFVTASVTLTWPAGIPKFRCNVRTSESGTVTYNDTAGTPGDNMDFPDGKIQEPNRMVNLGIRPDNGKLTGMGGLIE